MENAEEMVASGALISRRLMAESCEGCCCEASPLERGRVKLGVVEDCENGVRVGWLGCSCAGVLEDGAGKGFEAPDGAKETVPVAPRGDDDACAETSREDASDAVNASICAREAPLVSSL